MLNFRYCLTNAIKIKQMLNLITLDGFKDAWLN